MKRMIACMLMTVVLLLSLLVPAGADHAVAQPQRVVPLWNADKNWDVPDGFVVDTENQVEGEGCISITLKAKDKIDVQVTFPPIDATGMCYLEFDVYAPSMQVVSGMLASSYIEISSSGQTDKNAHRQGVRKTSKGCPSNGWWHVAILLESIADSQERTDPIDISSINFFRLVAEGWDQVLNPEYEFILKLDNFVLTDQATPSRPHTPSDEFIYKESGHETVCAICGLQLDFEKHIPPEGVDPCAKVECVICGGAYELDDHWYDCVVDEKYYAGPATCTEGTRYYYSCRYCGEMTTDTFSHGDPLGHSPSMGYVFYDSYGHAMKCGDCHGRVGEYQPHEMSDWKVVREATETETGYRIRKCDMCFYSEREEIPKTVPDPEDSQTPDVPETPQTPEQPDEPTNTGCTSVMDGAGFCVVALMLAAGVAFRKKK